MSLMLILQAIESLAVAAGVVFGLAQLKQLRAQREVQAGIELLHPLQAPQAAEAMLVIHGLPHGLSEAQLRRRLGAAFGSVMGTMALFESLGPLVARGHVPIDMYAESYRGITVMSWEKFRPYIEEQRAKGWPNLFEWLEWLAERLQERTAVEPDVPAYEQFRAWTNPTDYNRLRREHPR